MASASGVSLSSEVRFANAETRNAFAEELANVLARLAAKYHDDEAPGGRRFRFFVGGPELCDVVTTMKGHGFAVYDIFGAHYRPLDGALLAAEV